MQGRRRHLSIEMNEYDAIEYQFLYDCDHHLHCSARKRRRCSNTSSIHSFSSPSNITMESSPPPSLELSMHTCWPSLMRAKYIHPDLHVGATFIGYQECGQRRFDVKMSFKSVCLESGTLEGYLSIKNLTSDASEITTFFAAVMLDGTRSGVSSSCLDSSSKVNDQYNQQRDARKLIEAVKSAKSVDDDAGADLAHLSHIYIRLKEHFLVPDHHVPIVDDASFSGFYYLCYERATRRISGYYYHEDSEWGQRIILEMQELPCFADYDFR